MSFAAAIPAILQIASGVAQGTAQARENQDLLRERNLLDANIANLDLLADPIGEGLPAHYAPGGAARELMRGEHLAGAREDYLAKADKARADAWKYGGQGRSAGFMAASPYFTIAESAIARVRGDDEADGALADIHATLNDYIAPRESDHTENLTALADIFGYASDLKY